MSFVEDKLQPLFPTVEFTTDEQGIIKMETSVNELITTLTRLHTEVPFETLETISATDWIEDETIHLNYILYSYTYNETLFVALNIPRTLKDDGSKRTIATVPSVHTIWPQANQFEREIWEMMGVSVTDHPHLKEFFLENWQEIPPMRRDFDTLQFVNDNFEFRSGREDAMSVAEERKKKAAARMAAKKKAEEEAARANSSEEDK